MKGTAAVKIAIGVAACIVVVVGGFLLVQNVFTKASDTAPRDLIISQITTNTAKISWTTDQEVQGVIEYGSSPTSLNLFAPENAKQKNHNVEITLLSPATSYYFQIRIGETKYDNGGVPWTFSTKLQNTANSGNPTSPVASGSATPIPTVPGSPLDPTSASAFGPLKGSTLKVNPTGVPTPTKVVVVSTPTPALTSFYCVETDCQKICLKMKTGECSSMDFSHPGGVSANNCTGKVSLSNNLSCFWITPTVTPAATATPTPTPTNTPTPTP